MDRELWREISNSYGTPAYVFDLDQLKERISLIRTKLGEKVELCYAMKANPFLVEALQGYVDRFEVCSPGEYRICEKRKIPMEQIVLSGVYKSGRDIADMICRHRERGTYTIESLSHLEKLEECAAREDTVIRALIRITSGNQFGLDREDALQILDKREEFPHVQFLGFQHYSGTQKKKMEKLKKELSFLDQLIREAEERNGFHTAVLEYGPGFYVPYFLSDGETDDNEMLQELQNYLDEMWFSGKVVLEMGRFIAAYCGYYLTRIVDKKENHGQKYCIVDGGIHHLSYYGQTMAMKIPHFENVAKTDGKDKNCEEISESYTVCGSLCTVNDVLVKNLPLQNARVGDMIVFERVGAYSVTEGIYLFLSRDLPFIFFYTKKGGLRLVRRNQHVDVWNTWEI